MSHEESKGAAGMYERLKGEREEYLRRAREAASLTLPFLMPPEGHDSTEDLPTPFQSIGSRGVNNLASRLLLTLFPPNAPFFRLLVDPAAIRQLAEAEDEAIDQETVVTEIEAAIATRELEIQAAIEGRGLRVKAVEALKHLLIAGNALLWYPPEGKIRVYHLDKYVIKLDAEGNLVTIIIEEKVDPRTLAKETLAKLADAGKPMLDAKRACIYTAFIRQDDETFIHWREVEGVPITQVIELKEDELPVIPLRLNHISGESYSRGLVEEFLGDLISVEALTRAIVQGSAAAAHLVWLVNPNGFTSQRRLASARTGAFIPGLAEDVSALRLDKGADFGVAQTTSNNIEQRLQFVFLLNTAIQRAGERVTAEEIRFMAQELEDAFGGVFSLLSDEMQLPIVQRQIKAMENDGRLAELPDGIVQPKVVTGIEGLGRGQDLNRLRAFFQIGKEALGPEEFARRIDNGDALQRLTAATGINPSGLIKTDEQLQQEAQAQQQAENIQAASPQIATQVGKIATQQLTPEEA